MYSLYFLLITGLLVPICFSNCCLDLFIIAVLLFPKRLLGTAHSWGVGMWDSYRQNLFTLVMHGYVPILLCTGAGEEGNLEWRWFWFRHSEDPGLLGFSLSCVLPPACMKENSPVEARMRASCVYMGCFSISI